MSEEKRFDYGIYYKKYRPTYPKELYEKIVEFIGEGIKQTCVDFACGTGQSTAPLLNYFQHVIGIDASESQIENGVEKGISICLLNLSEKIQYIQATAEKSTLKDQSVDLVTIGTALHWFNIDECFAEVDRILKPGGTLAVWTYFLPILNNEKLNIFFQKLYNDLAVEDELDPEKKKINLAATFYKDVTFPYNTKRVTVILEQRMYVEEILGFAKSWSIVMKKIQRTGECKEFETFKKSVESEFDPDTKQIVDMPIELILSKKSK